MTATGAALAGAARDARRAWNARATVAAVAFAGAAFAPLAVGESRLDDLASGLYLALAATALALAVGIGAMPSLAQGAFMAIGAFTAAHLRIRTGLPTIPAALVGAAVAAAAGAVVGAGVVRLERGVLAVATWLLAWTVALGLRAFPSISGGAQGLLLPEGPSTATHYELALALVAACALGLAALARGPFGLQLAAARLHRGAAAALGVPVARVRLAAFVAAAAVGGLAGGLSVQLAAVADASTYSPFLSFKLFVAVLIGGALAALGPLAGIVVLGLVAAAAGALGSAEGVETARFQPLLAAVLVLAVLAVGGEGLLRPGRRRRTSLVTTCHKRSSAGRLRVRGLTRRYGEIVALDALDLDVGPGEVVALVGPNGSGKTTALRVISGSEPADGGTVEADGGVVRTLQATAAFGDLTALEHVLVATARGRRHGGFLRTLLATPKARAEAEAAEAEARGILERFGLAARADTAADQLSTAEQRVLAIASAHATGAGVFLLDEPAAGMSAADVDALEERVRELARDGAAIVVVEHNARLVRRVADRIVVLGALALAALLLTGCGGSKNAPRTLLVVVNAPFTGAPYVGRTVDRGASLAAADVNARGGVSIRNTLYRVRVRRMDNGLSPRRAVANVRRAVDDHAVAIVDEGTGVDATWRIAERGHVPIGIVFQGGEGLVDAQARPNVFRIAPTDHGIAFRLAEYLASRHLRPAILHDDSDYGSEGAAALRRAFSYDAHAVAADIEVPAAALDLAPEVLRARRSHATALLVWGRAPTIAAAITAARTAGWDVPVFTPPSGADPLVRQQLADHPAWVDGLTFASGRLTAELGPGFFQSFESRFVGAYGYERVGVRTRAGRPVVQPPEFAMYAYDFVQLVVAAAQAAGSTDGATILDRLNQVSIRGVNGDERGFNEHSHEGVVDDDIYFARFHDMTFAPVQDDPLSSTLPTLPQTQ